MIFFLFAILSNIQPWANAKAIHCFRNVHNYYRSFVFDIENSWIDSQTAAGEIKMPTQRKREKKHSRIRKNIGQWAWCTLNLYENHTNFRIYKQTKIKFFNHFFVAFDKNSWMFMVHCFHRWVTKISYMLLRWNLSTLSWRATFCRWISTQVRDGRKKKHNSTRERSRIVV